MSPEVIALMAVFAEVAQRSSFSEAAQDLRMSTATVSRKIAELEAMLGVRLFERSTRRVSLTEIGRVFHERCTQVLHLAEESALAVQELHSEPRGTLRVTAPILFGTRHLSPVIGAFMERHPSVAVELHLSDQLESLSTGHFDVAVRITNHLDDNVVARRLTVIDWTVCASPAYLSRHGVPEAPADLAKHDCYHYPSVIKQGRWSFTRADQEITVAIQGRLRVNSSQVIAERVQGGMGIGLLPNYLIGPALREGRLQALLPGYKPTANSALYALSLPNRYTTAKVQRFLDALRAAFTEPPVWDR